MGGRQMKKNSWYLAFIATVVLFIQLTIGFAQPIFASVEKSSIGITFKGSTSQTDGNLENQTQMTHQDSHSKKKQKKYPKTNEKNNSDLIIAGLLIVVTSVWWINWQNQKRETKK